jgi:tRNA dimethylallyltransferase
METYIIIGPTGVGKSDLAIKIAQKVDGEVVNMDMGQLYKKLSVGTAKPSLKDVKVPHHLYDIIEEPLDYNVISYRYNAQCTAQEIKTRNKIPLFVGGSLFYTQALFFELAAVKSGEKESPCSLSNNRIYSWQMLASIDPDRANEVHPHDVYRIRRALDIWYAAGKKPSECKPFVSPCFSRSKLVWMYRDKWDLDERINRRVDDMLQNGWQEEVAALKSDWHLFLERKKLCGYDIISRSLQKSNATLSLIDREEIKRVTRGYAKKQMIFWDRLKKNIRNSMPGQEIEEYNVSHCTADAVIDQIQKESLADEKLSDE